jgi:hypothetical protein
MGASLSIFAAAVGTLVWAAYSSFCESSRRGLALDPSVTSCRWAPIDVLMRDAIFIHRELWCCDVDIVVEPIILAIRTDVWVLRRHVIGYWYYQ